jgi:hypothetical protein
MDVLPENKLFTEKNQPYGSSEVDISSQEQVNPEFECRFCLTGANELICACNCLSARCHRTCLDRWRSTNSWKGDEGKTSFTHCEVCRDPYEIETVSVAAPLLQQEQTRYIVVIGLELLKWILVLLCGISFFAALCYLGDRHGRLAALYPSNPRIAYFGWGTILFFLVVDLCGAFYAIKDDKGCCTTSSGRSHNNFFFFGSSGGGHSSSESKSDCEGICFLICVILVVFVGIIIGLIFVSMKIKERYDEHLRILGNFQLVNFQRVKDRSAAMADDHV